MALTGFSGGAFKLDLRLLDMAAKKDHTAHQSQALPKPSSERQFGNLMTKRIS
ncbi:hypothetical protein KR52_03810 [Synechococcus sp. KORDI-52]|nr:hypothetical protein KR52_03810 [Synechococcus sp. KORDI-52]